MPPNLQHPDAHHAYLYAAKPSGRDKELEAWLDHALGAKAPDPEPVLHDL